LGAEKEGVDEGLLRQQQDGLLREQAIWQSGESEVSKGAFDNSSTNVSSRTLIVRRKPLMTAHGVKCGRSPEGALKFALLALFDFGSVSAYGNPARPDFCRGW